jgi:ribosome production factor 2
MTKLSSIRKKATTARGKRFIVDHSPKLVENEKQVIFLRSAQSSQETVNLLNDLYITTKPCSTLFREKKTFKSFDGDSQKDPKNSITGLVNFVNKRFGNIFVMASQNKKDKESKLERLVIGRLFDGELLDMIELSVIDYVSMALFKEASAELHTATKPLIVFQGPFFDSENGIRVKSILLDTLRGVSVKDLALEGVQRAIVLTAMEEGSATKLLFRQYKLDLKRTGTKLPFVDLAEIGPSFDMVVKREHIADHTMWKLATAKPKGSNQSKVERDQDDDDGPSKKKNSNKNISTDSLGNKIGRVHLGRQDLTKLYTPHHDKKRKSKEMPLKKQKITE